jgi:hypothetical protein
VNIFLHQDVNGVDVIFVTEPADFVQDCLLNSIIWAGIYMWDGLDTQIAALMMGTEMVPETSVIFNQLTWLIAQEYFINVSCQESFTSYIVPRC